MERCLAQKGRPFSLIAVDIDNFRSYNDAYGYAVGDAIIARFGRYLQTSLSTGVEMVGRVGSEEYLAIVDGADRDVLDGLTSDLLSVRLTIDGEGPSGESTSVSLTAGAGVVSGREAALTPAALIHQAEVALRKAKQLGRSRRYAFETDDAEFARLREICGFRWSCPSRSAMRSNAGVRSLLPAPVLASNGRIVGEALARWRHPSRGLVSPAVFIPPLERSGAIVDLDLAIFEQCCRFLRDRLDKGAVIVPLNCNFSRLHFLDDSFADALKGIVDRYAVPPSYLCAEITESAFVEDFDTVIGQ
ncbi:MAG: diguanylate cyclase [Eggerthella lenta]